MADEKVKIIKVTSGREDNRVALWEKHPDHPGSEVFVAGTAEVEVAETRRVLQALASGDIVRVGEKKPAPSGKGSDK